MKDTDTLRDIIEAIRSRGRPAILNGKRAAEKIARSIVGARHARPKTRAPWNWPMFDDTEEE